MIKSPLFRIKCQREVCRYIQTILKLSCALGDCEPKYPRRRSHKREGKYLISTKRNLLNLCTLVTTLGDVISLTESNENTPYPPRPALTSIVHCDPDH